ncbi:tRNA (adenine-N1)-methyltransferase [Microbacterium sp. EYE_5]|nr:tRNA (adenine-N1)-methyltransferase [Microbacterium sp. EYE_382]MCK6085819.1 tRNA (adenine-N1)-methyltransferase [Microbacterium sp. EYE_384]MCK6124683.1 tRNA (adenine-N1)-methyltransferase [Microbacterium sp. EYE_80]MCK6127592.1 tRNA (adenine-N1)-methyltransferase [Microbacterium sp. EYE_79]MCK6141503.1 tRNA (adenine-N1)-methyltransferase [Microbacterium sp. EYE_39]MCK6219238.1 tRNA (adenine-N1)-methyltransferase [Microbacterium sp. EYE_5]MCK6228004.1 tRNA (adenine-N1)-methyltransferase [
MRPSGPFRLGDRVQLTGPKGRLHTITLREGGELHTHHGVLRHEGIIGQPDGSVVVGSGGHEYLALRPLLRDFVMSMPRGAAIVYPKDAAQILAAADIFPGATVVEAGVGSGALSLWLLRAIGTSGRLHSFERREEFSQVAEANVETFLGHYPDAWNVVVGDLVEELPRVADPGTVDRVVLDMLAPWECIDAVAEALTPGGVVLCYIATATQLSRVAEYIRHSGLFTEPEATETMVRGWHVEGLAVRPDHRMVAHTGFLLTARRLAPGAMPPDVRKRALKKPSYADADVEAWTPGAVGDREITDKNLRKRVRDAQRAVEGARQASGDRSDDTVD